MVSRSEVEFAYRLFLGREPENDSVVIRHMESCSSLSALRASFMASREYRDLVRHKVLGGINTSLKATNWPRTEVEVEVSPEQLARMIRHVEATWENLGRADPHWSVLVQEKYRATKIGANKDDFFESGKDDVGALCAAAARCGVRLEDYFNCFELGCGVGRLSIRLAELFPRVVAADISASHLEIAKETIAERACRNVELVKLNALADLKSLPAFDVFFSLIVLQHNPPPVIAQILRILLEKLRPGGIAFFQVPTYALDYDFIAEEYLEGIDMPTHMEMHVLPQQILFELIEKTGCQLLEIREDDMTGTPTMVSNSALVSKRP